MFLPSVPIHPALYTEQAYDFVSPTPAPFMPTYTANLASQSTHPFANSTPPRSLHKRVTVPLTPLHPRIENNAIPPRQEHLYIDPNQRPPSVVRPPWAREQSFFVRAETISEHDGSPLPFLQTDFRDNRPLRQTFPEGPPSSHHSSHNQPEDQGQPRGN